MRTLLIGVAAAGFVAAVSSANAQQGSTKTQGSSATQAPSSPSSATQAPSSPSSAVQAPSSPTATTPIANKELANKELSGVVKKIDKDKRSLKLSSPAGVDQDVQIAASATIMRDGAKAELDQLKEGDDVRASFDPASNQATKLDVQSKHMMKDKGMSEPKTDSKGK